MRKDDELRHLAASHAQALGWILAEQDQWKALMGSIPKKTGHSEPRFNVSHIEIIEQVSKRADQTKTAFEVLVSEWGTMGRVRPTVGDLLQLCLQINALRAASYVNSKIIGDCEITLENVASFLPNNSQEPDCCFDQIDGSLESLASGDDDQSQSMDSAILTIPLAAENMLPVPAVPFSYLKRITANFGEKERIGSGGFADVYLGRTLRRGIFLAVKRMRLDNNEMDVMRQQINNEVAEVARLRHHRLLTIYGYNNDHEDSMCLIYPYMVNGNLEERLHSTPSLTQPQRMVIMLEAAKGILFLHSQPKPLLHRDIKTSNILLDDSLLPKIADFGLLRHASTNNTETTCIRGTSHYMAPEATRGDISVKTDVFSFGVVMLEIITGLKSYDKDRVGRDIVTYMEEQRREAPNSLVCLLDEKAPWLPEVGLALMELAFACIGYSPSARPAMKEVVEQLERHN